MDISIFLAKLIGIILVISGLASFIKRDFFREVARDFVEHPAFFMFGSMVNILLGLLIILNHHIWELNWKGVITAIGYLFFIRGLMLLFAPEWVRGVAVNYIRKDSFMYVGAITLALGAYLLYHGFVGSIPAGILR